MTDRSSALGQLWLSCRERHTEPELTAHRAAPYTKTIIELKKEIVEVIASSSTEVYLPILP